MFSAFLGACSIAFAAIAFAADAYLAAVAPDSGLNYDAADSVASFTAPNGVRVRVGVKAPRGLPASASCAPPACYAMREMQGGELPDTYFPAAVAAAQAAHATRLVVPRATYDFRGATVSADSSNEKTCNEAHYWNCGPHWQIGTYPTSAMGAASVADLDIDLCGSILNFAAPGTGIWILNAARVRLENFTIDWPALHIASLGTIVPDPANPGHRGLVLDAPYSAMDPLRGGAVQIQAVDPWDDSADPGIAPGRIDLAATNDHETYFIFGASQPTYLGKTRAGAQSFSCSSCRFRNSATDPGCSMFQGCANFDGFRSGARVIVRHYTYNGFAVLIEWSSDIDLEGIHILSGPGMGIAVENAGGFRGFRLAHSSIARGRGRLLSTASDAVNISALVGDVIVEDNDFADQGDDGVNISPSAASITASHAGSITMAASCTPNPRDRPMPGDVLAFFDAHRGFLGTARAASIAGTPCGDASSLSVTMACSGSTSCLRMVEALVPGETFVDLTLQPVARYFVSRNHFHDNRGQGMQAGAPYGAITGNTFSRNSMGAIHVDVGGGLGASSVLVSGNTVSP